MKTKYFLRAVTIVMATVFCCTLFSCGPDGTLPDFSNPFPNEDGTGEVTFVISQENSDSVGNGTDSPAVVQTGDTLEMAISQTSSYTDPDGSVFICEPKATIKLSALGDTLYVKDFQTLTTVKEISQVASETTSGEKLTKQTLQTFDVGGKEVIFDLAYDIFNHINSEQQSVEMPYIKINSANFGSAKTEETKGSAPAAIKGIKITPHTPQTRGTIVDSTAYDVNVAFNLEIESVNAKESQNQTLSFEVEFLAVVKSVTEYPDPEMYFSYQLQILGGTNSTSSPFRLNLGETMHLQWVENSQYNYFSLEDRTSQTISHDPKAFVKLFADRDTLWVTNEGELEQYEASDAVITEEGTSPFIITGQKTFSMAGKNITFDWGYETYDSVSAEGTTVAVPHLELSEPQIVSVNAVELMDASIPGKTARLYDVTVRFSQQLKTVNIPQEHVETIEYIVKYIGAFEVKLVKVVYRKAWEWVEPHDNMPLAYYPIVYRDRIYSTGETFTDTFRSNGYVVFALRCNTYGYNIKKNWHGLNIFYDFVTDFNNDSIHIKYLNVFLPDTLALNVQEGLEDIYFTNPPGNWDEYVMNKNYTEQNISLDEVEVIGSDSISAKPSGWYFFYYDIAIKHNSYYVNFEPYTVEVGDTKNLITIGDTFLVIDGQMITFSDFLGTAIPDEKEEDVILSDGTLAKVITRGATLYLLGRKFYAGCVYTIIKKDASFFEEHMDDYPDHID